MTESEWLTCDDASAVFDSTARRVGARKVRLALCGCLRAPQIWPLLTAPASRRAVEVGEAYADGDADRHQLGWARRRANSVAGSESRKAHPNPPAVYLANYVCLLDHNLLRFLHLPSGYLKQLRPHAGLLRDVLGNPFRPATIARSLRTSAVVSLAEGVYADRAFDRLPILADALEDAGCDDERLLAHCRGEGPHVRGCWALDLILGKT